jgi:hypothetical protein
MKSSVLRVCAALKIWAPLGGGGGSSPFVTKTFFSLEQYRQQTASDLQHGSQCDLLPSTSRI